MDIQYRRDVDDYHDRLGISSFNGVLGIATSDGGMIVMEHEEEDNPEDIKVSYYDRDAIDYLKESLKDRDTSSNVFMLREEEYETVGLQPDESFTMQENFSNICRSAIKDRQALEERLTNYPHKGKTM